MKKEIVIPTSTFLVLVILLASISFVFALTIGNLSPEQISLFAGQVTDSDFTIDDISTEFLGSTRIRIRLTIRNTDVSTHSGNVTITLLNSTGDMISIGGVDMMEFQLTGDISGSGTTELAFNFEAVGLVSEYQSNFIATRQLT